MKLKDIVTFVSKSVVPQRGAKYNLYSLPSFDENKSAEVLDGAEIQSNKYDVPNKCILFNKLNVRFKRVWRINNSDSNKIASTEFLPLVVNEDVVDYQYCYYLLISDEITNYLCGQNSNTSGSHKRIDPQNFLNIDIHLPKMPIQKAIGKTLSNIDRKIELNKRINDNLEAMAKQLYNYWFVQFDFPNEEGKPYKSSGGAMVYNERLKREVPIGWEVENLIDFAEIKNGATPSTADEANYGGDIVWITPKDLSDQQSKFVYQGERNITKQGFDSCSTSMLPTNSVLMSSRAPIGLVSIAKHEVCTNQGFKSFIPKSISDSIYLYYYIKHHIKQIEQLGTGTTFKEVSRDDLCKFPILTIGAKDIYVQWIELQNGIADKQLALTKEIAALTKQRDELLPLLMNGQASVNYHLSAKVYPLPIAYKKAMPIVTNQTISNTFIQKFDNHTHSPCLQTSNHSIPKEERNDL